MPEADIKEVVREHRVPGPGSSCCYDVDAIAA
jgi:hypothetical protein